MTTDEQLQPLPKQPAGLPTGQGVWLGVDFGRARHGVAVSDGAGILATPLTVVVARPQPAAVTALAELARAHGAIGLVVGLPLGKNGEENDSTRSVRSFGGRLAQAASLPVMYQDERYSTEETLARLQERGAGFAETKASKDSWAAALILQDFLDRRTIPEKNSRESKSDA